MSEFVKTCGKCGPLTLSQIYKNRHCIKCSKIKVAEYQGKNKDKLSVAKKLWQKKNPEKIKVYRAKFNQLNHDLLKIKNKEYGKKYYQLHIDERKETLLRKGNLKTLNLHNSYVLSRLARQLKMKSKDIPIQLVELKRQLLKLKRIIRSL